MTPVAARVLEHVHGHLGWLATAALVHPAILLRRAHRRSLLSAASATLIASGAGALGAALYPCYREIIKPVLFAASPRIGWAFERKEHLAIGAIALAWAGLAAHWGEPRASAGTRLALRRAALVAYTGAAALALVAATLGVVVACARSF